MGTNRLRTRACESNYFRAYSYLLTRHVGEAIVWKLRQETTNSLQHQPTLQILLADTEQAHLDMLLIPLSVQLMTP